MFMCLLNQYRITTKKCIEQKSCQIFFNFLAAFYCCDVCEEYCSYFFQEHIALYLQRGRGNLTLNYSGTQSHIDTFSFNDFKTFGNFIKF